MLIYYSKLMGITLDELVGKLEPAYQKSATDNALWNAIKTLKTFKNIEIGKDL